MKDYKDDVIATLKAQVAQLSEAWKKTRRSHMQVSEEAKHHAHAAQITREASLKMAKAFDRLMNRTRQGIAQRLKVHGVDNSVIMEIEQMFPLRIEFPKNPNGLQSSNSSSEAKAEDLTGAG